MSKYLAKTVETYRVNTEEEVKAVLEEFKMDSMYELKKAAYEKKEVKEKGEIVDEFWVLTVTKLFNDLKLPDRAITVKYEGDYSNNF